MAATPHINFEIDADLKNAFEMAILRNQDKNIKEVCTNMVKNYVMYTALTKGNNKAIDKTKGKGKNDRLQNDHSKSSKRPGRATVQNDFD